MINLNTYLLDFDLKQRNILKILNRNTAGLPTWENLIPGHNVCEQVASARRAEASLAGSGGVLPSEKI